MAMAMVMVMVQGVRHVYDTRLAVLRVLEVWGYRWDMEPKVGAQKDT